MCGGCAEPAPDSLGSPAGFTKTIVPIVQIVQIVPIVHRVDRLDRYESFV